MKLSVIIVNYNVKYFLEQCLHSVMKAIKPLNAEVLVIDNASTDGSAEYLKPLFPSVVFIKSEKNLGFGKANNAALQQAKGEYTLFLNPDTIVPEDCFEKCISFLEKNAKAGALGIKMLDGSGIFLPESKRSFPDTKTAFFKLTGLSSLFPESPVFNRYALGYLSENENHKVDVLAGAFMMFKHAVLKEIGGFDEAFFMYGEDIDLSYRCKLAGFDNWYFAESSIIHFKGESAKKGSLNHTKMFYQAMIVFVNKHYKGKGAGAFKLLLNTAIWMKAFTSWVGNTLKSNGKKINVTERVVVGTTEEYEECLAILQQSPKEIHVSQSISAEKIGTSTNKQFIFCNSSVDYKQMITLMQQIGPSSSYRFHASGSKSIVGSDSKNTEGEVFFIN